MEDEEATAMLKSVGRQIKLWREAAGMKQPELGAAIGYSGEMVSSVERGRRAPKPDFLDNSDDVLGAGGKLSAFKEDLEEARYPKKVRDLKDLEDKSIEMGAYTTLHIHGLLQTPEYAQALYENRRPPYTEGEIDRLVSGRMARKIAFERVPPGRYSLSSKKRCHYGGLSAEGWCYDDSLNTCWKWASCHTWTYR